MKKWRWLEDRFPYAGHGVQGFGYIGDGVGDGDAYEKQGSASTRGHPLSALGNDRLHMQFQALCLRVKP